jgi:hypothetical protein
MKPDRSRTSSLRRFMRPIIGVGTLLVVSAGAVAVAQGASPDRAPSAASTMPATGESMVVQSSAVLGADAVEAVASTEGHPIVGAWLFTPESSADGRRHPAAFGSDGIYWMADAQISPASGCRSRLGLARRRSRSSIRFPTGQVASPPRWSGRWSRWLQTDRASPLSSPWSFRVAAFQKVSMAPAQ